MTVPTRLCSMARTIALPSPVSPGAVLQLMRISSSLDQDVERIIRGPLVGPFLLEAPMLCDVFSAVEKSVFVVTYGRSGSTLVQNLLNGLPGACVRGENENLLAPLVRAWDIVRHSKQRAEML